MVIYEGNRVQRGREKIDIVVTWLFLFGFSTRKILCQRMKTKKEGQDAFFKKLIDQNILEKVKVALFREEVYRLTYEGHVYAQMLIGNDGPPRKKHIVVTTLMHDLTVQVEAIKRDENVIAFTPEKFATQFEANKFPDVILDYGDEKLALEVELSHKNNTRLFYIYLSHLHNIKKGYYTKVEYLFSNQALLENYKGKFLLPEWPIIKKDSRSRLKRHPGMFNVSKELHNYFSFNLCGAYE